MKHLLIFLFITCTVALFIPVSTWAGELPEAVKKLDPETMCPAEGEARGWDIRGYLITVDDTDYLALYFDPGFNVRREPWMKLKAGSAVFVEKEGTTYFYRLGKTFGGKQLGRLSFDTRTPEVEPAPIPGLEKKLSDKVITMDMERRGDSPCLRLIEQKSHSVYP